jgi:hypothetical protein
LKALLRGPRGPLFDGKYVAYLRFKKEWCAYRRTYHAHVRDKPASQTLKEKSLAPSAKALVGDVEDLSRVWDTLDTCYDRPEKYIPEALEPIIKFRKYRIFEHIAI